MVAIRTPANQRIIPNWNVQALANAIAAETGATNFGTYLGHSPSAERATDAFSTIPMPRSNRVLGDAIAEYCLNGKVTIVDLDGNSHTVSVWEYFGCRYIIWRQRINWNDGEGWIAMENRGDDTQNHFDHDHIATNVIPRPTNLPGVPAPVTQTGGNEVLIVNVKNTGIFLLRGSEVSHLQHPNHVFEWVGVGVPYQDRKEMSKEVFQAYTGWGASEIRGLTGAGPSEGDDPGAEQELARQYEETLSSVRESIDQVYDEYVRSLQVN